MFKALLSGIAGLVFAVTLGLGTAIAGPVPLIGSVDKVMDAQAVNKDLIKVYGCHANKQRHMVYKWGYEAWHRHASNCRPLHARPTRNIRHCHRNYRKHRHDGRGNRWHRHVGRGCHYQRGHVGRRPNGRRHNGRRHNGGDCIRVGGILICSN